MDVKQELQKGEDRINKVPDQCSFISEITPEIEKFEDNHWIVSCIHGKTIVISVETTVLGGAFGHSSEIYELLAKYPPDDVKSGHCVIHFSWSL